MEAALSSKPAHQTLTKADIEALAELPGTGWFGAAHLPINRPFYRCERLEQTGCLITRVVGVFPDLSREYQVVPEAVTPAGLKARSVRLASGEMTLFDTIIEHYYPEPESGAYYYVDPEEMRAAKGLERKRLVTVHSDLKGPIIIFTALGADVFYAYKAKRGPLQ